MQYLRIKQGEGEGAWHLARRNQYVIKLTFNTCGTVVKFSP